MGAADQQPAGSAAPPSRWGLTVFLSPARRVLRDAAGGGGVFKKCAGMAR